MRCSFVQHMPPFDTLFTVSYEAHTRSTTTQAIDYGSVIWCSWYLPENYRQLSCSRIPLILEKGCRMAVIQMAKEGVHKKSVRVGYQASIHQYQYRGTLRRIQMCSRCSQVLYLSV